MNEIIDKLERNGDLNKLFKGGFISWTVIRDKDIYMTVMAHMQTGMNKTRAVKATSDQFQVSDELVWIAIRKMK